MSLLRLTLLICFVSAFVAVAQGFQCYTCFNCTTPTGLANCEVGNQCFTSRTIVGNETVINRGCDLGNSTVCNSLNAVQNTTCVNCNKDACNPASEIPHSIFLIVAAILVAVFVPLK